MCLPPSVNDIVYVSLISGRCWLSEIEFLATRGKRSWRASYFFFFFLRLGTGFLLAGLDPLIVCPAMFLLDNDKGRG